MTQFSIRFYKDDVEVDRIDADLPAEASEIVAACREWVDDWMAASKPLSEEETAAFEEAFAQHFARSAQGLDERMRAEEAAAVQMLKERGWRVEKPD